jgi:hypothetical protein
MLIADSSGSLRNFSSTVSVNNSGTVSFFANPRTGVAAIFTGDGGALTTIAESGPFGGGFGAGYTSINASGTVAFSAQFATGGAGIFTGSGGPVTTIVDTSQGFVALGLRPSINNVGTVAFLGSRSSVSGGLSGGLFVGNGGPITTLYDDAPPSPYFAFGSPAINDGGLVAFSAGMRGTRTVSIFTGNGGATTTIADTRSEFTKLDVEPSVNNAGMAAFQAILVSGVDGIFTGKGGPLTRIADTTGSFRDLSISSPVINDNGSVVFLAELDTGGMGIFTGPDTERDRVIAIGDPLFGSTVVEFFANGSRLGFNDAGEVAFVARLADGRDVVVRASPIPEPDTLYLLAIGGLGLVGYSWRQRRQRGLARDRAHYLQLRRL